MNKTMTNAITLTDLPNGHKKIDFTERGMPLLRYVTTLGQKGHRTFIDARPNGNLTVGIAPDCPCGECTLLRAALAM